MTTSQITDKDLVEEIQRYLPDASLQQVKQFNVELNRLSGLEKFFEQFPERNQDFQEQTERAAKALDYKRPYRIAVIGTIGAGKSTLINALLSRELVLTKSIGKPATGTALNIFLDVSNSQPEVATVNYRNEKDVHKLIGDFVDRYRIGGLPQNAPLDARLKNTLLQLEPPATLSEQGRREFLNLRDALSDIITQYIERSARDWQTDYSLDDQRDCMELSQLIDEDSDLNEMGSVTRRIGLIKSVTYHIRPAKSIGETAALKLPGNVCLVDLPGLDGKPLHDIIISEGIREADAVVFVVRPPRILGKGDSYLLERVRRYISMEGNVDSGERVFLVLNARDSITSDESNQEARLNSEKSMRELTDSLVSGYNQRFAHRGGSQPYFETSALAAYGAQARLQNKPLADKVTYESIKLKLGLENAGDHEVLAASQIPLLVESLTRFASEHRIEGQIREARQALDSVVETLRRAYKQAESKLTQNRGEFYLQSQIDQTLKNNKIALQDEIQDFRMHQLGQFEQWRSQLKAVAQQACNETDRTLRSKIPAIWEKAFSSQRVVVDTQRITKTFIEVALGDIQLELWHQLTQHVSLMAEHIVKTYREQLNAYRMTRRISSRLYGCIIESQLESLIDKQVESQMRQSLVQTSRRIAITAMTDPSHYFTAVVDGRPAHTHLFASVQKIAPKRKISDRDCDALVAVVRQQYEPFVSTGCVRGLLNLHRYEMIQVELYLLSLVEKTFRDISHSTDPVLKSRLHESLATPEIKQLEGIQSRLAMLSTL